MKRLFAVFIFQLVCVSAFSGVEMGAVLPKGIFFLDFRSGAISNMTQKYNGSGQLLSLSRFNMRIDSKQMKSLSPEKFKLMEAALQEQGFKNLKLAEKLSPGDLLFKGGADVRFYAPVLGYGVTEKWTLGIAIPIVSYSTNLHVQNGGINNAKEIFDAAAAKEGLNKQFDEGRELLQKGAAYIFRQTLKERGYKDIPETEVQRKETFLGDVRLGSYYKLRDTKKWKLFFKNDISLPTGPKKDPDDLTGLNIFGRSFVETGVIQNYIVNEWLSLGLGTSYKFNIPDSLVVRVPKGAGDVLPGSQRKEKVSRHMGGQVSLELAAQTNVTNYLSFAASFEHMNKSRDAYSGNRGNDYSLLGHDTVSYWNQINLQTTLSSVNWFMSGKFKIPMMVSYAFSDVISGKNVERQYSHELSLKLFF